MIYNRLLVRKARLYPNYLYMYSHHWDMYIYQITSFVPRQVHACHTSRMYLPGSIFEVVSQKRVNFTGEVGYFFCSFFKGHNTLITLSIWPLLRIHRKLLTWQKLTRNLCSTVWGGRFCFCKPLSIQISGVGCTKLNITSQNMCPFPDLS